MARDDRVNSGHDAAPFVKNLVEVGVTDAAKQDFDLHVAVSWIATRNRGGSQLRCRTGSGVSFRVVRRFMHRCDLPSAFQLLTLARHAVVSTNEEPSTINFPDMKSLTEHLWFELPHRRGFINITPKVEELLHRSGVTEGLCLVNAMHITASVFINDDEPGLHHDYEMWLEKLAPHAPTSVYLHNRTGEDNADAHLKRQVMGREVVVAITKGKLDCGPSEQIFYGEFDGRRKKRVLVKIIGE